MNVTIARANAIGILQAGIQAVQPGHLIPRYINRSGDQVHINGVLAQGNIYVIGAGKAAAAMAQATEQVLGDKITAGVVTTKYGHSLPTAIIRIVEAAHPIPDENGLQGVKALIGLLTNVTAEDTVLCLLSGGASALWPDLPSVTTLTELQALSDQLIRSGASIAEINTVRKHLSSIKGGQLAKLCHGAQVHALIISDVPGDDLSVIASGPTVADASTYNDAIAILERYELWQGIPVSLQKHLEDGSKGINPETPKPGDPTFDKVHNTIIASNNIALAAAVKKAEALGYYTIVHPFETGDAELAAEKLLQAALEYDGPLPAYILQGGETTVKVTGNGLGGRNQHFVLTALKKMQEAGPRDVVFTALSAGTDGTDGPTDAAGAIGDWYTLQRAGQAGLDIACYLQTHDAYHFFQKTDSLLITGPTQTNVMDLMMVQIS
ncbi:glycerate kinase type-2 family protein [Paraflavitalea pollutisoli]|uniref:glycerate kinase type-2 family protein n=1 Tax=Paraflavitalea pollutisoli TaxID=3034143 RepID=UPI0023EB7D80|nr:glycerate kinase [Paraflavitalea sp. H1-2-19X]